ncbi:Wadjet anti-phage system protein JetA family protein [Arcobacter peruensis]|uniref:Wadjet anti-phage system protein JetA family protein n=1 Tax=Arcobacter peruensis TaxID=2320140 RepID=UPI000F082459|nr:Wadjet anti-phage system protein JetA family protein [Arcobacter peruensis]
MITKDNPDFFSILTGKNSSFFEKLLVTLYSEIYRGIIGEVVSNKNYMKSVITRTLREINFDDENIKYSSILNRLESSGWIETKYDNALMEFSYNFTRSGRKMAQTLYQLNNKETLTRHRNVRTTLGLLDSYKRDSDPYDLVDALDASDYIVSDLMEQINEINDVRKKMIKDATQDVQNAGENFLDYLEKDFKSTVVVYFQEDSISQNANRINEIIYNILDDEKSLEIKNQRMVKRYPNFSLNDFPVETQLQTILDRVANAKDSKMPELIESISSLFKFSEMVLKQVSSLMIKRSSYMNSLALEILASNEDRQEKIITSIAEKINIQRGRYLDPSRIKIKTTSKRRTKSNTAIVEEEPSREQIQEQKILEAIRKSKSYISKDIQDRILKDLKDDDSIINSLIPINSYKDLSYSLNLVSVAKTSGLFDVESTGDRVNNRYFTTDEFIIKDKGDK